eukprot:Phypoly_transcript_08535.p1 GENE.Phypoly_transcript_08535~~Phypoly_transcript_08535.p1  ORF type:complete len:341 (+),score=45.97 Phypoly_transcript_08535:203-1225(+)
MHHPTHFIHNPQQQTQQIPTWYDETAQALFHRAAHSKLKTGITLFDTDARGLKNGDIVEIYGPTSVGKTELLYSVIVSCVLPRKWNDVTIGGHGVGVIYFDNDYHFCMPRLISIIEHRVRDALDPTMNATDEDIQELITLSLARLQVFHCKDSLQFIVTLQSIPLLLESDSTIKVLMIDSISAFYWIHKHEDKTGIEHQKHIANQCRLLAQHGLVVMATKAILWKDKRKANTNNSHNNVNDQLQYTSGLEVHNEYLHNWGRLVKYRVVLSPHSPNGTSAPSSSSQFIARLHFPSPPYNSTSLIPSSTSSSSSLSSFSKPTTSPPKTYLYSFTDWGMLFLS